MFRPNFVDRFDDAFLQFRLGKTFCGHIGQTIQHNDFGVDFIDQIDQFWFQAAIARRNWSASPGVKLAATTANCMTCS